MESRFFDIGDIVTLQTHPYFSSLTEVIISGDHIPLPPLMVIIEAYKAKQNCIGSDKKIDSFKYRCIWFSAKNYRFEEALISEIDLKMICKNESSICKSGVVRGDKVILKSANFELGKKKSSLAFEDNSVNSGNGLTTINPLLSFLSPVMQVLDITPHETKHPLKNNNAVDPIRVVHKWDVKCSIYNSQTDRISEIVLPLDSLKLIEPVDESLLKRLQKAIIKSRFLSITTPKKTTIAKPRNIVSRCGLYYLRSFDYLLNKVTEHEISTETRFSKNKKPFEAEVPGFDIVTAPEAATEKYILKELKDAVVAYPNSGPIKSRISSRSEARRMIEIL